MKKLIIIFISITTFAFPQSQTYFDYPFGGGGGFMPGYHFVNLDDLNTKLVSVSLPKFSNEAIFVVGGGGFIYIGFIPQLRIGGLGYGGTKSLSHFSNNVSYQVDYNLGVGGFTLEYTLPFFKDFAVSIGTIIGGGEISVDFYENKGIFTWSDVLSSSQKNNFTKITNEFFLISPTLNIDIPIYRFLSLRLGGGYQYAVSGKWQANNNQTIFNVPDSFNGNSFFINSGIYFGFFAF